jgi:CheY-like chemotaxis protein
VAGEGSTFRLRFRAAPAADGSVAVPPSREPGILAGRRVLIVDDNATNRRILVAQTKRWEMVPLPAADGPEALAIVDGDASIDVALLDLNMPDLDGLALAERLRIAHPKPPIPVIILSSIGSHDLHDAPVVGTLTKPVKPSALHDALADALGAGTTDAKPSRAASARPGDAQPLRILLAEDNAVNRKLALKLLEQLGYAPDVAANGLEAVEAVEATPYDVVLMDVQMPELDGLEATRRIRSSRLPHPQPRIVAMTANAMAGDREACLAAGMDDYVSKPIRPPELAAALSKVAVAGGG